MTGQTEWPHLVADLKAKRAALDQVIETIETHFVRTDDALPAPTRRGGRPKKAVKKRTNERTNERTSKVRAMTAPRSLPSEVHKRTAPSADNRSSVDVVQARDAAILARLRKGPAPKAELILAMPSDDKNADQRSADCGNALTRLRLKKSIKQVDEGWALA